jgi:hypothetical protein
VSEITELSGAACDFQQLPQDDPRRWLLIQAGRYVERKSDDGFTHHYSVPPNHVIAFETSPGEGCEPANFGLCKYPVHIETDEGEKYIYGKGFVPIKRRIKTNLPGWSWSSFCKTQYASSLGVENFLRCHLTVIHLLDRAKDLGLLADVSDEGDYWENRDAEALTKTVGEWNGLIAAFVGKLKDNLGVKFEAPITKFRNFEHLEAHARRGEP